MGTKGCGETRGQLLGSAAWVPMAVVAREQRDAEAGMGEGSDRQGWPFGNQAGRTCQLDIGELDTEEYR